jgi:hypothetical protein
MLSWHRVAIFTSVRQWNRVSIIGRRINSKTMRRFIGTIELISRYLVADVCHTACTHLVQARQIQPLSTLLQSLRS